MNDNRIQIDNNTYFKKVTKEEYDSLISLMNISFNMQGVEKFEHILPKFYYKDNETMIHYGIYNNDELVSSIGLYPMLLVSKFSSLNVACIGAVSTHPNHRLKGYFSILMNKILEVAKENNYDLLFLGGNRFRYGHFGFETAGRKLVFMISNRTKKELKPVKYNISLLNENDMEILDCLNLYNLQPQRASRTISDFYKHIISWNCVPYVVKHNNQVIGYYCLKDEKHVYEFIYKEGYRDTLLDSIILDKNEMYIQTSMNEYDEDLISKVDWFRVEDNEMYLVQNWENVAHYLNFSKDYKKDFKLLNDKQKVRKGLGNVINKSEYSSFDSLFIFPCDQG